MFADVLDQFSANAPSSSQQPSKAPAPSEPTPSASGPGRPEDEVPVPDGPREGESEEEFMKRLTEELSTAMSKMSSGMPDEGAKATPEELAKMGKELEEFTLAMEKEGIQPEDLLKAILGEKEGSELAAAAHADAEKNPPPSQSRTTSPTASKSSASQPQPASAASFEDTIRRTMERMETSSAAATSATQKKSTSEEEDMLAELLKSLGPGADGSDQNPDDLSNMFLNMMQQLTNKSMLYEPMKELDSKFPQWIDENSKKLKSEDATRYRKQQVIVRDIVKKFEEKSYSDEDPKCRDFIWEKMQAMQEQGAPPEELIDSPLPGMGGLGDLGKGEGGDEGCPTQ